MLQGFITIGDHSKTFIFLFFAIIKMPDKKIKVEVSNRHVHLSKKHIEELFGEDYELSFHRELSQPGQYAAKEKIHLIHEDKKMENVRVLGPSRNETQVEILKSDSDFLNLEVPKRLSGILEESPGIILEGPRGKIKLEKGLIIAHRHLHASHDDAKKLGVEHNQKIKVRLNSGKNETILDDVIVRVHESHVLALHLDCDEGKTCFIDGECWGEIVE